MSGSRKPDPDADLFAATFRDVKPLRRSKISPHVDPAPAPEQRRAEPPKPPAEPAVRPSAPNPGIDRSTAERLRKGRMDIDRRLDLHGLTEADAHGALDRFVRQAWRDGVRVLLVITGKGSIGRGGGVLRRNLPRWLASGEHAARVLKIETAQPRHGGNGAYYVLLRRRREGAPP